MLKRNYRDLLKIRIFQNLFYSLFIIIIFISCGYKADPKIPYKNIPQRITAADIEFSGENVYLRFNIPHINERGERINNLEKILIYRKINPVNMELLKEEEKRPLPQLELRPETETQEEEEEEEIPAMRVSRRDRSDTQEAFGFGRDMSIPGSETLRQTISQDYKPIDFKENYKELANIKIVDKENHNYLFTDNISQLLNEELTNPIQLSYTILLYDDEGNQSKFSNIFSVPAFHTPSDPVINSIKQTEYGIEIDWEPSKLIIDRNDYSENISYDIYMANDSDILRNPFIKPINKNPIKISKYLDRESRVSSKYYYSIRSRLNIKSLSFQSSGSNIHEIEIISQREINPVEGILSFKEQDSITILWKPHREAISYNVYRKPLKSGDDDYILLNEEPVKKLRYEDNNLKESYTYYITAVISQKPYIESKPSETVSFTR